MRGFSFNKILKTKKSVPKGTPLLFYGNKKN